MLRVGVIGVGTWGQQHARVYSSLNQVRLVGVSDVNEELGRQVAERYRATYHKAYQPLVGEVDAVSIAVPTVDHYPVACHFLEHNTHVLIEKPISTSLQEADGLIALAKKKGLLLQVGHLERFNPAVVALRGLVKEPKFFEVHRLGVFAARSLDIDVVLDLMIHDLDILLSLVKSDVVRVSSVGIPILTPKIDIANARLEFANGCVANVTASRVSSEKIRKLRFFQPNSYISLDYEKQTVASYSLVPAEGASGKEIVSHNLVIERGEPLRAELESFVRSIEKRSTPECTGEDGKKALDMALRVLGQMKTA